MRRECSRIAPLHNFSTLTKNRYSMRILLIDIDSLRPDHLGAYGYDRDTSPTNDSTSRTNFGARSIAGSSRGFPTTGRISNRSKREGGIHSRGWRPTDRTPPSTPMPSSTNIATWIDHPSSSRHSSGVSSSTLESERIMPNRPVAQFDGERGGSRAVVVFHLVSCPMHSHCERGNFVTPRTGRSSCRSAPVPRRRAIRAR